MASSTGIKITELKVDGGASANNLLMSIQANVSGISITRPKCVETTAHGAALLCGLTLGTYSSLDEIKRSVKVDMTFSPNMDESRRKENISRWRRAVERSLEWKI
jgi:glycerol kinase